MIAFRCWHVIFGSVTKKHEVHITQSVKLLFLTPSVQDSKLNTHAHTHTHTYTDTHTHTLQCQMVLSKSALTITPPLGPTHHCYNSDLMEQQLRGGRLVRACVCVCVFVCKYAWYMVTVVCSFFHLRTSGLGEGEDGGSTGEVDFRVGHLCCRYQSVESGCVVKHI